MLQSVLKYLMDFAFIFRLNKDTTKGVSMALARTNLFNHFHCIFLSNCIQRTEADMFYETQ